METPGGRLLRLAPLAAALLLASGFGSEVSFSLVAKRVVGETETYAMSYERKTAHMTSIIAGDYDQKVTKTSDDGGFTVVVTMRGASVTLDGQPFGDGILLDPKTYRYDARGNFVEEMGESGDGSSEDLLTRYGPAKAVAIGETWTPAAPKGQIPSLRWKLVGRAKLEGKSALLLEALGNGEEGDVVASKIWLDVRTFALMRMEGRIVSRDGESALTLTRT